MITIDELIKIIIGIFVVIAVVLGIGMFFKNYVIDFFKNIFPSKEASNLVLCFLR